MQILGVFHSVVRRGKSIEGYVTPLERGEDRIPVPAALMSTFHEGDAVMVEVMSHTRKRTFTRVGSLLEPRTLAHMAILEYGLPELFTSEALAEAGAALPPTLEGREDLRSVEFVTIDGVDAKDFDDAVWAAPHPEGGWQLKVAIADVSHYVPPGSALDREAFLRGNSVYLPGMVVPMLPEALSNGLCSLRPLVERACVCAHLHISASGEIITFRFSRGLMISRARLTYEQVEETMEAPQSFPELEAPLRHLWGAYESLLRARKERQTLDFDLAERCVALNDQGEVTQLGYRTRLRSHQLIEEMMIAANVAAAMALEQAGASFLYRVHEPPPAAKIDQLKAVLKVILPQTRFPEVWTPKAFMAILKVAEASPLTHLVHAWVLRTQSQASYTPRNKGHFGLHLERYAHFTSPIRRYADLVVHRALEATILTEKGASHLPVNLAEIGEHISQTERQAAAAERSTLDRLSALYLNAHARDCVMKARVTGVHRVGVFVTLDDLGASGMIPISCLSKDFLHLDEKRQALVGRHDEITLGATFDVTLGRVDVAKGRVDFIPVVQPRGVPADKGRKGRRGAAIKGSAAAPTNDLPRRRMKKPPRKRKGPSRRQRKLIKAASQPLGSR